MDTATQANKVWEEIVKLAEKQIAQGRAALRLAKRAARRKGGPRLKDYVEVARAGRWELREEDLWQTLSPQYFERTRRMPHVEATLETPTDAYDALRRDAAKWGGVVVVVPRKETDHAL